MTDALRRSSAHIFVDDVDAPVLADDDRHHLARVLRLRDGESVSVSDGRGRWRVCTWGDGVLATTEVSGVVAAPEPRLVVAVAPVKGDRTDLVVEKLVEVGIDRIVVLAPLARSVVRRDGHKGDQALERYRRIARAAAMQSRRTWLPDVVGPVALEQLLTGSPGAVVGVAEPGGTHRPEDVTTLLIGPEGGFDDAEIALAGRAGAVLVDLGATILRAETAAIVGAARMVAHRRP